MRACIVFAVVVVATAACADRSRQHFENGERYLAVQQHRAAIIEFRNAVAADPNWGAARLRLAEAYDADGQLARAYQEYLRAAELLPHDDRVSAQAAQTSLRRAERSFGRQQWTDALRSADAALAIVPELIAAHRVRAEAAVMLGRFVDATQSYEAIAANDPADTAALVALSRLHLAGNDVDAALARVRKAVEQAPDDDSARLTLVRVYIGRGEDARAHAELQRLSSARTRLPEYYVLTGTLDLQRGEAASARDAFARALQLDPGSRDALTALTTLDVRAGDIGKAQTRLAAAIRDTGEDPAVLVLAAKVSITAGELATAEVILRRAVARDPAREDAVRLLAQVFDAQDRVAVAVAEFDAVARREPANTTARLIAAVTIHTAGAMAEAQRRYEEVLAADAGALLAAKNLAGIYAAGNVNLIEAERLATTVAARHPHGEIFDTLGSIHLQRHVVRPAIEWFEQAVRLEPRRARFRYHLGVAYARAGAHDRARAAFKEALRLDSGLTAAREALAALGD